jgi:hypothetical protein
MNADHELLAEVSEARLRAMLDAYAGPDRPQTRPTRRKRGWVLAAAAAATLALAAVLGVLLYDRSGDDTLRRGSEGLPSIGGVTRVEERPMPAPFRDVPLDAMVAQSELVFVGTVAAIEGPVELSPASPPDYPNPLSAYRVTFNPERVFRGSEAGKIVLSDPASAAAPDPVGRGAAFAAEVGKRYLVLAQRTEARPDVPVLVPFGLDLGIFPMTGPDTAENARGLQVTLDEVERLAGG